MCGSRLSVRIQGCGSSLSVGLESGAVGTLDLGQSVVATEKVRGSCISLILDGQAPQEVLSEHLRCSCLIETHPLQKVIGVDYPNNRADSLLSHWILLLSVSCDLRPTSIPSSCSASILVWFLGHFSSCPQFLPCSVLDPCIFSESCPLCSTLDHWLSAPALTLAYLLATDSDLSPSSDS